MSARMPFAELKAAVRLPAIIGEDLGLRRQGRLWSSLCPFHNERTPSFYVWDDHYHCFGCGAHGDVFDWFQRMRRMTLAEAIKLLVATYSLIDLALLPIPLRPAGMMNGTVAAKSSWLRASGLKARKPRIRLCGAT